MWTLQGFWCRYGEQRTRSNQGAKSRGQPAEEVMGPTKGLQCTGAWGQEAQEQPLSGAACGAGGSAEPSR